MRLSKLSWVAPPILAFGLMATVGRADETTSATESKSESTTKESGKKSTTTKSHWVTGTVKSFDAGKSIEVTTAGGKDRTFDLDDKDVTATVDPDVAVGAKVKVKETTANDGHKTISVKMASAKSAAKAPAKSS